MKCLPPTRFTVIGNSLTPEAEWKFSSSVACFDENFIFNLPPSPLLMVTLLIPVEVSHQRMARIAVLSGALCLYVYVPVLRVPELGGYASSVYAITLNW